MWQAEHRKQDQEGGRQGPCQDVRGLHTGADADKACDGRDNQRGQDRNPRLESGRGDDPEERSRACQCEYDPDEDGDCRPNRMSSHLASVMFGTELRNASEVRPASVSVRQCHQRVAIRRSWASRRQDERGVACMN